MRASVAGRHEVPAFLAGAALSLPAALPARDAPVELPQYAVKDIGTLGGRIAEPADLNEAGQVTGYAEAADGQLRAFLYSDGKMLDLGALGGTGSLAHAINESGQVTGFALTTSGAAHAFLYSAGTMTDLGALGGNSDGVDVNAPGQVAGDATLTDGRDRATLFAAGDVRELGTLGDSSSTSVAINDVGDVTGTYDSSDGTHAFLYRGGSMVDLVPGHTSFVFGNEVLNAAGQVTGSFETAEGSTRAFLYQAGHAADLGTLGGDYSDGLAINAAGHVTGIAARADGLRHAFIHSAGTMSDLGTLGGTVSIGYAINDSDAVTGEAAIASQVYHAFVHANGRMTDLGAQLEALAGQPLIESVGYDINNAGQVIGRFSVSDPSDTQLPVKTHAFLATPIAHLFESLLTEVTGAGPGKSLEKKIERASRYYAAGDRPATCAMLAGFIKEVQAQSGKKIDAESAAKWAADASAIRSAVSCP